MQVFNASMSIHSINSNAIFSDMSLVGMKGTASHSFRLRLVIRARNLKIDNRNIRRTFNCFMKRSGRIAGVKAANVGVYEKYRAYCTSPVNLTMRSLVSFFQYMIVPFLIAFGDEDGTAPYSLFSRRR